MHGQIYLGVAGIAIALACGASYALVTEGGKVSATTAAAIEAVQETIPEPPTRERADTTPPQPVLPAVAELLRAQLAGSLGISPEQVTVVNVERVTWTDSCLGLGGPQESCALMMTAGYHVTLSGGAGRYVYRTDLDGTTIRPE